MDFKVFKNHNNIATVVTQFSILIEPNNHNSPTQT